MFIFFIFDNTLFDTRIIGVSRDSVLVHEQFTRLEASHGGVFGISFPLLEDVTGAISRKY